MLFSLRDIRAVLLDDRYSSMLLLNTINKTKNSAMPATAA